MTVSIDVDKDLCKGCGICIQVCPKRVYKISKTRNSYGSPMPQAVSENECIICRMCERLCPDGAINVEEERK